MDCSALESVVAYPAIVITPVLRHGGVKRPCAHCGQHRLRCPDEHLAKAIWVDGATVRTPNFALSRLDLSMAIELIAGCARTRAHKFSASIGADEFGERIGIVGPDGGRLLPLSINCSAIAHNGLCHAKPALALGLLHYVES